MNLCLLVIGIVGQFCYSDANPIGECVEMNHNQHICVVAPEELSIRLSAYDPAWCEQIPTNCDGDTFLATGAPYEPYYLIGAACPLEWLNRTVTIAGMGSWLCVDTGGAIRPTFRGGEWFIPIDVLYPFAGDPRLGENWPIGFLLNYSEWSVQ